LHERSNRSDQDRNIDLHNSCTNLLIIFIFTPDALQMPNLNVAVQVEATC